MAYEAALDGEDTGVKKGDKALKYGEVVARRSIIEDDIGLMLANDSRVTEFASKIQKASGVKSYEELKKDGVKTAANDKVDGEVDTFGGARAFKENWGTLGGSVFAVMNEIEKDKSTKERYSISYGDNPYFDKGQKKPEFDKPMSELHYEDLPGEVQKYLTKKAMPGVPGFLSRNDFNEVTSYASAPSFNYDQLVPKAKFAMLENYRLIDSKEKFGEEERNLLIKERNGVDVKTQKGAIEYAEYSYMLDNKMDRHSSGNNANMVKRGQNKNTHENRWIEDTVFAGKPIISGPSGHTLRYLNFWKERKGDSISNGPSLEAARLVMMANLMPPKHHSYDEIMTSSIGIKDNVSTLQYNHKDSYKDLDEQKSSDAKPVAEDAYTAAFTEGEEMDITGYDVAIKEKQQKEKMAILNAMQQNLTELDLTELDLTELSGMAASLNKIKLRKNDISSPSSK